MRCLKYIVKPVTLYQKTLEENIVQIQVENKGKLLCNAFQVKNKSTF